MAGVYGRLERRGLRIEAQGVQHCMDTLACYGSNGSEVYCEDHVVIGVVADWHRKENVGHRVVREERAALRIAGDIRLDNRDELFEKLKNMGLRQDSCDGEYVLVAYQRWGKRCPKYLLGDFAFVIWNASKSELFCARDALGIRPLYYFEDFQRFVCASSIRAIFATGGVPHSIDEMRIADYLAVNFEDQERTFFKHVRRLPGGHSLTVCNERTTLDCYFKFEFGPELRLRNSAEYAEAFRELFVDAVRTRMEGCSQVGLLLSGGLDSSSVAGVLHSLGFDKERPISTFSAEFPGFPEAHEREWMDAILEIGNFDPSFVRVDQKSPLAEIEEDYRVHEEPFYAPNLRIDTMLLRVAKQKGISVLIDGIDGDTTVGHGWEFLAELARIGKWRALYRQLRELENRSNRSLLWLLRNKVLLPNLQEFRSKRLHVPSILNEGFSRKINYLDRMREQQKLQFYQRFLSYRMLHFRGLCSGLLSAAFQVEVRQAAHHGIVRRHPYFDKRLVEFCLSLPSEQRMQGIDRMIQRRALQGLIPYSIQFRIGKGDWSRAFEHHLWHSDRYLMDQMLQKFDVISKYVDRRTLDVAYQACKNGCGTRDHFRNMWVCLTLFIWIDRKNASRHSV